jgi:hypothetical protein
VRGWLENDVSFVVFLGACCIGYLRISAPIARPPYHPARNAKLPALEQHYQKTDDEAFEAFLVCMNSPFLHPS